MISTFYCMRSSLFVLTFLLLITACFSDVCSSSPADLTEAQAKKCLASMDAEVSEKAFEEAAATDSLDLVRLYIGAGLSTQAPLDIATEEKSTEAMQILMEYGADPSGDMLRDAVSLGHFDVARILIEEGVNPNDTERVDPEEFFAAAMKHEDPRIANLLLDQGLELSTDPTFRSPGIGDDPATNAACYGHWETLRRVLQETEADASFLQKNRSILETGAGIGRIAREVDGHEACIENILSEKTAEIAEL